MKKVIVTVTVWFDKELSKREAEEKVTMALEPAIYEVVGDDDAFSVHVDTTEWEPIE